MAWKIRYIKKTKIGSWLIKENLRNELLKILFDPKTEHIKVYLNCTKKKG